MKSRRIKEEKYKRALIYIRQMLGTGLCKASRCEGCQYEALEATETARKALGWKRSRIMVRKRWNHC